MADRFQRKKNNNLLNSSLNKKWSQSFEGKVFYAVAKLGFNPKSFSPLVRRVYDDLITLSVSTPMP